MAEAGFKSGASKFVPNTVRGSRLPGIPGLVEASLQEDRYKIVEKRI